MKCVVITTLLSLVHFTLGTYLPSIYWDPTNPILKMQYWHKVVQVKIFDILTFICPNDVIKMTGRQTTIHIDGLYQNLYVKEISADIKSFDGICDTEGNSTFIINCNRPKEFYYQNIEINLNQANPRLPTFEYSRDYIFFATSNGTRKSLDTTSKICTMVFRIHFNKSAGETPFPSPLLGREKVCENPHKKKEKKECQDIIPRELNVTTTTANSVTLTWQPPSNPPCNTIFYTVCYREPLADQCKEVLVPAKQHNATLSQLGSAQEYVIKVRANTAKGPGGYCDEITLKTEPEIPGQKEEQCTSIHGISIGIGIAVGFFLSLVLLILLWVLIVPRCKKKGRPRLHCKIINKSKDVEDQDQHSLSES